MKTFYRITALLLLCGISLAQSNCTRKDDIATQNFNGFSKIIPNALVTVCGSTATGQPCTPPATIYSDNACSVVVGSVTADVNGNFHFYADPTNKYKYQISGSGVSTFEIGDVTLPLQSSSGVTLTKAISSSSYNNVVMADTHSGATDTLKLQGCLADAITNKTACDARNFTNRTFTAEIDVGDASFDPVTLLLPTSGTWHFTMADGTSYGLKQFNKTAVIGQGTGEGNAFKLNADTGSNLAVLYGTDPSPSSGGSYVYASGFGANADTGSTIATAVCNIQKLFDGSQVSGIACNNSGTATSVPVDLLIQSVCCNSTLFSLTADAQGSATSNTIPCKIGASVVAVTLGLSCDHPSAGKNNILVDDGGTGTTGLLGIYGYAEGIMSGDTTTPLIDIKAERGGVNFTNFYAHPETVATTAYCWQIENVANMPVTFGAGNRCAGASDYNAINDLFAVKTLLSNSAGAAGFVPEYVEDGVASGGVVNYYHNGITSAGTITGNQLASTVATGTAPLVVASTTNVANLNASSLNGATFASPGAIGGSTPAAGTFTSVTATGTSLVTLASTTVGALPSAASNSFAQIGVTDSTAVAAEGQTCVGGSTNKAIAVSNGTVWKCF